MLRFGPDGEPIVQTAVAPTAVADGLAMGARQARGDVAELRSFWR